MPASLHLARYSPRATGRMVRAMLRHRDLLDATPGLAAARLMFTAELDTLTGGRPTLTRWGLMCGWDSSAARDAFVERGFAPFESGAREAWSVSLDTVMVVKGQLWGWHPSTEGIERLGSDEPLAVMTYGLIRPRHLPAFTVHNRRIVRELAPNPAQVMMIGLAESPLARCTFSLWRSKGEVVRFAYGEGIHNPIQRRALDVPWGDDFFFARFRPVASRGTWAGRDPLAELRQPVAA